MITLQWIPSIARRIYDLKKKDPTLRGWRDATKWERKWRKELLQGIRRASRSIGSRSKLRLILKACFSPKSRPYETQFTPLSDNTVFCEARCLFIFTLNALPFAPSTRILSTNHGVEGSRNSPFVFVGPSFLLRLEKESPFSSLPYDM